MKNVIAIVIGCTVQVLFAFGLFFGHMERAGEAAPAQERIAFPKDIKAVDIVEGYYEVAGTLGGNNYDGLVVLVKPRDAQHYVLYWMQGKVTFSGVGLREDDKLVVGWGDDKIRGLTIYTIEEKKLVGRMIYLPGGGGEIHKETLTFLKAPGFAKVKPAEDK